MGQCPVYYFNCFFRLVNLVKSFGNFSGILLILGSCTPSREEAPAPPTPVPAAPETPVPEIERPDPPPQAQRVEIRRTSYGVPHILAEDLEAGAFGLAWVMMEDYREDVPAQILASNGRWAAATGRTSASAAATGISTATTAAAATTGTGTRSTGTCDASEKGGSHPHGRTVNGRHVDIREVLNEITKYNNTSFCIFWM